MKKTTFLMILSYISIVVSFVAMAFVYLVLKQKVSFELVFIVGLSVVLLIVLYSYDSLTSEKAKIIEKSLDEDTKMIVEKADVGILIYDEDYEIIWVSDLFRKHSIDHTGEKILSWLPELETLLKSDQNSKTIIINDGKYLVSKSNVANTLTFKDVTKEYDLTKRITEDAYVLGLVNYDNYDEASESEEDISYINANIKVPVIDYFKKFNIDYKTLKNNRLLLIMNEKQYKELLDDHFSIMATVRKESKKADLLITLSMAFARGSQDLVELDNLAVELIDLAQTRGGDQVVSRIVGQEAVFYGGASEAREKQSKVKVRVISNTLKDLISKSSNVIITGHIDSDSDCVGAAICVSTLAKSLKKETYVVLKNSPVEAMISEVLYKYKDDLKERHNFISETEAYSILNNDSLVIMVDHHSLELSNARSLVKEAKRVVVIDHHRRKADLDFKPLLVYIEAGASSTCELVSEFIPYFSRKNPLTIAESNIMYLGIIIDTNHFRNRAGSRTFEAAKYLREIGADPTECERLAQEPYQLLKEKTEIISSAKEFAPGILICAVDKGVYSRSIASSACDLLIQTKGIKAVFVLCKTSKEDTIITARSNGEVNVQVIMEDLNGGGHMTAAGLQRKDIDIKDLLKELLLVLRKYL